MVLTPHELLTAIGTLAGIGLFALRLLWRIRGSWDQTNSQLKALVTQVTALVSGNEADHARLERRTDEVGGRLERHLEWHDKH